MPPWQDQPQASGPPIDPLFCGSTPRTGIRQPSPVGIVGRLDQRRLPPRLLTREASRCFWVQWKEGPLTSRVALLARRLKGDSAIHQKQTGPLPLQVQGAPDSRSPCLRIDDVVRPQDDCATFGATGCITKQRQALSAPAARFGNRGSRPLPARPKWQALPILCITFPVQSSFQARREGIRRSGGVSKWGAWRNAASRGGPRRVRKRCAPPKGWIRRRVWKVVQRTIAGGQAVTSGSERM